MNSQRFRPRQILYGVLVDSSGFAHDTNSFAPAAGRCLEHDRDTRSPRLFASKHRQVAHIVHDHAQAPAAPRQLVGSATSFATLSPINRIALDGGPTNTMIPNLLAGFGKLRVLGERTRSPDASASHSHRLRNFEDAVGAQVTVLWPGPSHRSPHSESPHGATCNACAIRIGVYGNRFNTQLVSQSPYHAQRRSRRGWR